MTFTKFTTWFKLLIKKAMEKLKALLSTLGITISNPQKFIEEHEKGLSICAEFIRLMENYLEQSYGKDITEEDIRCRHHGTTIEIEGQVVNITSAMVGKIAEIYEIEGWEVIPTWSKDNEIVINLRYIEPTNI
ncbi:MAG: hypothetical protein GY928_14705 [Colwellia sp.]|nr:hypothetical protein [Colwellia sp.]